MGTTIDTTVRYTMGTIVRTTIGTTVPTPDTTVQQQRHFLTFSVDRRCCYEQHNQLPLPPSGVCLLIAECVTGDPIGAQIGRALEVKKVDSDGPVNRDKRSCGGLVTSATTESTTLTTAVTTTTTTTTTAVRME
ncbi:hypothetical protein BV898_17741 [Hypsibius exemplaris]|uniref:Uncharacterized protein n=1 Tax=Hypsibius exemplaris TaxID=2072580 RepID=A0A9X6NMT4_HYPEX|nr:hypothetical protein BV898_17741 [Hypsibius exemplaris]